MDRASRKKQIRERLLITLAVVFGVLFLLEADHLMYKHQLAELDRVSAKVETEHQQNTEELDLIRYKDED